MLLYYTDHGSSPTLHDAHTWLEQADLGDVQVIAHEHQIVVGRKLA